MHACIYVDCTLGSRPRRRWPRERAHIPGTHPRAPPPDTAPTALGDQADSDGGRGAGLTHGDPCATGRAGRAPAGLQQGCRGPVGRATSLTAFLETQVWTQGAERRRGTKGCSRSPLRDPRPGTATCTVLEKGSRSRCCQRRRGAAHGSGVRPAGTHAGSGPRPPSPGRLLAAQAQLPTLSPFLPKRQPAFTAS